jgi:hypothetical protein
MKNVGLRDLLFTERDPHYIYSPDSEKKLVLNEVVGSLSEEVEALMKNKKKLNNDF